LRVWVNTADGWIQHGQVRTSPDRAAAVAKLLATRLGWETASGETAPPPRQARDGAPTAKVAAKSPAPLSPSMRVARVPAPPPQVRADFTGDPEPYLEELASFAMEAQLRDFLIARLPRITIGGMSLRLYQDSGGRPGREYPTAVGPIDVLAVAPDGTLVVMELKLDRGPDRALGQLARYMGWVRANLAGEAQVRGVVVARRIDEKLRYAAAAMPGVLLLEYEIDFRVREVAAL
jgi:hypothetical protein